VANLSCVKAVLENLGRHLKSKMPHLAQVIYEFPSANVQLRYPSISILAGNPQFTPLHPYLLTQGQTQNNKASVKRVVGAYDFELQLDLWCRDKFERFSMYEEFFQAFNSQIMPMGLSLKMSDYYDVWCRYDLIGYDLDDSEISSQRAEWRARINLLANTRAVIEKTEIVVETIENNLTTPNEILAE
jgi:hypothetical protein